MCENRNTMRLATNNNNWNGKRNYLPIYHQSILVACKWLLVGSNYRLWTSWCSLSVSQRALLSLPYFWHILHFYSDSDRGWFLSVSVKRTHLGTWQYRATEIFLDIRVQISDTSDILVGFLKYYRICLIQFPLFSQNSVEFLWRYFLHLNTHKVRQLSPVR